MSDCNTNQIVHLQIPLIYVQNVICNIIIQLTAHFSPVLHAAEEDLMVASLKQASKSPGQVPL